MEPRRLRSEGIGSGWMIPDVKKRGRPYIQRQDFQQDRPLTQEEADMVCSRQFKPEVIAKLLDESQFTTVKEPLNYLTMGVTESEMLEQVQRTRDPCAVPWHPDGRREQQQYYPEPDEPKPRAPRTKPPQGTKWHDRKPKPNKAFPNWTTQSWLETVSTVNDTHEDLAQNIRISTLMRQLTTTPPNQSRPPVKKSRNKPRRNSN